MIEPVAILLLLIVLAWIGLTACLIVWLELRDRDRFEYVPVRVTERGRK